MKPTSFRRNVLSPAKEIQVTDKTWMNDIQQVKALPKTGRKRKYRRADPAHPEYPEKPVARPPKLRIPFFRTAPATAICIGIIIAAMWLFPSVG